MNSGDRTSSAWIRELASGNEAAVAEFWRKYGERLQRLAASRMSPALQRRTGAEDVVQSVCRTFFRRSAEGQFQLQGTADLWRLLCAITLTKVRHQARFHHQEKRSIDRERNLFDGNTGDRRAFDPASPAPTPAEIAEIADEMQRRFDALNDEERQFVQLRIEGMTQFEIAEQLGRSERTVRRLLKGVKERWQALLDESHTDDDHDFGADVYLT